MKVSVEQIKKLREETGAGVMDLKKALAQSGGDVGRAKELIEEKGLARAEKKGDRDVGTGVVGIYQHHDWQSGAMVELLCETDFVARTDEFRNLSRELAMQVTSNRPESVEELLSQAYNREPKKTVSELIKSVSGKLGEKIELKRFERLGVGEEGEELNGRNG